MQDGILDNSLGIWRMLDASAAKGGKTIVLDYRIVSATKLTNARDTEIPIKVECLDNATAAVAKSYSGQASQVYEDPWVYRKSIEVPTEYKRVTIWVGARAVFAETFDLGQVPNTDKTGEVYAPVPRITLAVNSTPQLCPSLAGDQDIYQAQLTQAQLKLILERIWARLQRGLDPAWMGTDGGRGLPLSSSDLEESWARGFDEMATGAPYQSPNDTVYLFFRPKGGPDSWGDRDSPIYDDMCAQRDAHANDKSKQATWYPLAFLCQQVTTCALITRNYPLADLTPGMNAGGSNGRPVFKKSGGAWHDDDYRAAKASLAAAPPARPGSVYEFYETANSGAAHIAPTLRVHGANADGGWQAIQMFDVGGMNAPDRGAGAVDRFTDSTAKACADPWMGRLNGPNGSVPKKGLGVPYPTTPQSLAELREWWPLGFAQLVIKQRSDDSIIFASPLLRMHTNDLSFPMALYGWSLRALPYASSIHPYWLISVPRGSLARHATRSRSATTAELVTAAKLSTPAHKPIPQSMDFMALTMIDVNRDGRTHVVSIFNSLQTADWRAKLPWGQASGSLVDASFLAQVPAYLRGEAPTAAPGLAMTSTVFTHNGALPVGVTQQSMNISPPLRWTGTPANTQSFALIVEDSDAGAIHWVLYNLDPSTDQLNSPFTPTSPAAAGMNYLNRDRYDGPSPPPGPEHHYHFRLFALDTVLSGLSQPSAADLRAAMAGHILAETDLVGTYAWTANP